jgi:hypothetical protein
VPRRPLFRALPAPRRPRGEAAALPYLRLCGISPAVAGRQFLSERPLAAAGQGPSRDQQRPQPAAQCFSISTRQDLLLPSLSPPRAFVSRCSGMSRSAVASGTGSGRGPFDAGVSGGGSGGLARARAASPHYGLQILGSVDPFLSTLST